MGGNLGSLQNDVFLHIDTNVLGLESLSRTIFLAFLGVVLTSSSDLPGSLTWLEPISSSIVSSGLFAQFPFF